jgi:hypothetical protein
MAAMALASVMRRVVDGDGDEEISPPVCDVQDKP